MGNLDVRLALGFFTGLAIAACTDSSGTSTAQPCYAGQCPLGYECVMNYCLPAGFETSGSSLGDGDGDPDTGVGDGDGDPDTGVGDGDGDGDADTDPGPDEDVDGIPDSEDNLIKAGLACVPLLDGKLADDKGDPAWP